MVYLDIWYINTCKKFTFDFVALYLDMSLIKKLDTAKIIKYILIMEYKKITCYFNCKSVILSPLIIYVRLI